MQIQQIKTQINKPVQKTQKRNIQNKTGYHTNPLINSQNIKTELLKAYFLPINFKGNKTSQIDYVYKPISSLEPNYEPLNCDYSNIEEFSRLYSEKLDSQLMTISLEDVKQLIKRIKEKTGADEQLIHQVLYHLTCFSNYSSLDKIQELLDEFNISEIGAFDYDNSKFYNSSDTALSYLVYDKKLLDLAEADYYDKIRAVFLDKQFLSILKAKKEGLSCDTKSDKAIMRKISNAAIDYQSLINRIMTGKIKFFNIAGWDIKCSDGKYRSANFLSGTGFLEDLAIDVIKQIQQRGGSPDDILYGDFEKELSEILGFNVQVERIKFEKEQITTEDIYENLKTKRISKEEIKNLIQNYFTFAREENINSFLEYLDESTFIFSSDSYAYALIKLFKEILKELSKNNKSDNEITKDDIVFCIPELNKSFAYITYVFGKINDINQQNILGNLYPEEWNENGLKHKPKIIIDDISASGTTQNKYCSELSQSTLDSNIAYTCLIASETAKSLNSDFKTVSAYEFKNPARMLDFRKRNILNNIIMEHGYKSICSCCAFPYMIPDSNNDFASILFTNLLHKNTIEANRGMDFVIASHRQFYKELIKQQKALQEQQ